MASRFLLKRLESCGSSDPIDGEKDDEKINPNHHLFPDIGGVQLTGGLDHRARKRGRLGVIHENS
jgi:hypothetical protein